MDIYYKMGSKRNKELQPFLDNLLKNPPKMLEDLVNVTKYQRYALSSWAGTYAVGVEALAASCANNTNHPYVTLSSGTQIPRPLTFEESIRAIVENYNTLERPDGTARTAEEKEAFMCYRVDTCSAIAYKYLSVKFKLVPMSMDLVHVTPGFLESSIKLDYDSLLGIELSMSGAKYSEHLGLIQAYKHPAWNALVTDKALLKNYLTLVFRLNRSTDFGFYTDQGASGNELRSLVNICRHNKDGVRGDMDLHGQARFIKVLEK